MILIVDVIFNTISPKFCWKKTQNHKCNTNIIWEGCYFYICERGSIFNSFYFKELFLKPLQVLALMGLMML